jgi:hypothetical protein
MTPTDVLFRYAEHPTERTMMALNTLSEVYGIRALRVNEAEKQVRVEFDASRMTRIIVRQLLRRTGLDVIEEVSLIPPQPAPPAPAHTPAPVK